MWSHSFSFQCFFINNLLSYRNSFRRCHNGYLFFVFYFNFFQDLIGCSFLQHFFVIKSVNCEVYSFKIGIVAKFGSDDVWDRSLSLTHLVKCLGCGSTNAVERPRAKISFEKMTFRLTRYLRIDLNYLICTRNRHFLSFFWTIINSRAILLQNNVFTFYFLVKVLFHQFLLLLCLLNLSSWRRWRKHKLLMKVCVDQMDWLWFNFRS